MSWAVLLCMGSVLAGCQSQDKHIVPASVPVKVPPAVTVPAPVQVSSPAPTSSSSKMMLCQRELASLRQANPKAYAARKAHFDRLVSKASVYGGVRSEVNIVTKDTLDALYTYKTNQLCVDIERDVMQGLVRQGESVK
ncbi:hypothetical protein BSQ40_24300 [Serratia fonticola]|nr:hypothetical protein BSQ40_24300 [Serratia fonticola]